MLHIVALITAGGLYEWQVGLGSDSGEPRCDTGWPAVLCCWYHCNIQSCRFIFHSIRRTHLALTVQVLFQDLPILLLARIHVSCDLCSLSGMQQSGWFSTYPSSPALHCSFTPCAGYCCLPQLDSCHWYNITWKTRKWEQLFMKRNYIKMRMAQAYLRYRTCQTDIPACPLHSAAASWFAPASPCKGPTNTHQNHCCFLSWLHNVRSYQQKLYPSFITDWELTCSHCILLFPYAAKEAVKHFLCGLDFFDEN